MQKRFLLVSCGLLFLLGLIALMVGIYLWRTGGSTDNNVGVTPTVAVSGTVEVTPTEKPATTVVVTQAPAVGDKLILSATENDQLFKGPYFTLTVPAGWAVVQKTDNKNAYFITKNNYYIEINASEVTGGGYGYPYNGVCEYDEQTGSFSTDKFQRIDNVFDITNKTYNDFVFFGCSVNKNIQLGNVIWLGSRLVDKGSTMPAIDPYKYFNKAQTGNVYVYFIDYAHLSQGDISAKYPVWDSAELNDTLKMLDKIAGSVVFTKDPSFFTHTDGLG